MNAGDFLLALARNSLAAGVLVLLVLATQRVFRRQLSPFWHCALWLLVLVRLLPFSLSSEVSLFNLVPWRTEAAAVPQSTASLAPVEFSAVPMMAPQSTLALPPSAPATTVPAAVEGAAVAWHARLWDEPMTALFWLLGVVALASGVGASTLALARDTARATPVTDPAVLQQLRACCAAMRVRRMPLLLETSAVTTPALYGLLRPRVLLPPGFTAAFSAEEQRFVFLHELAHVRRGDLWVNWLFTTLQILHWFNPLVWLAFARWRVDREIACDAAALDASGTTSTRSYGETMLRLLENLALPSRRAGLIGILEDNRQLHRRMKMIAAFTPARRPFAAIGLLAILGLVGLTDAQVPSSVLPPSSPSTVAPLAAADSPPASTVTARAVDEAIATEIAERFEGDRRKFLEYLKSRGITQREFRREMTASLLAGAGGATPSSTPLPKPTAPYVLFLVNASETMRTEFSFVANSAGAAAVNRERGQPYVAQPPMDDAQARATAKWQRTADALELMLLALQEGTHFHVAVFSDNAVTPIADRALAHNPGAIPNAVARLRAVVPRGAANLEAAFTFVKDALPAPERIVLITDGLPTASTAEPMQGQVTEAQRIKAFQQATKRLPPRIPVHTVLLAPPTADPGAAGLYWELANATRGQLTVPAKNIAESRTHLAFVIDTSGSMRDPNSGGLWPIVTTTIESALDAHPELAGLQFLDGDGRFILGRQGVGAAGWLPNNVETREKIRAALRSYKQDTVSNPVPGVANAIRFLRDKSAPELRMGIYVLGDEFNSSDNAGVILDRIEGFNPRDAHGRRAVTISAIGFPTTIRYQFSMGNTGLRFANLMRQLTAEHDGSFIALPDL